LFEPVPIKLEQWLRRFPHRLIKPRSFAAATSGGARTKLVRAGGQFVERLGHKNLPCGYGIGRGSVGGNLKLRVYADSGVGSAICASCPFGSRSNRRCFAICPAQTTPERDNAKPKEKKSSDESFKLTDWLLVLFSGLLALYTWRLYLATRGLVEAAHNQSEDMKASTKAATDAATAAIASNQIAVYNAEQQLRAYVTALEVNLRLQRRANMVGAHQVINGPVHTYSVSVVLKNGGQTPTRNLAIGFSGQKFIGEMPDTFDFPDSDLIGHGLIGPGSALLTPEIGFDATEFERTDANFRWYVWGWVEYDDVFRGTSRHRTEFCFEIKPIRDPHTNEIYVGFPTHKRFNAADWDTLRRTRK
jgi:hypothetical protein